MDALTSAVRHALTDAPFPLKTVAAAVGVPHATIAAIAAGESAASLPVAESLSEVYLAWSQHCGRHAVHIALACGRAKEPHPT